MLVRQRANFRREPSQARSSFTLEAILDAAQLIVLRDGPEAVQMAMLARRAGTSAGTVYQYFTDKTAVLVALMDRNCTRFIADVQRAFAAAMASPLDTFLEQIVSTLTELAFRDRALKRALMPAIEAIGPSGLQEDMTEQAAEFLAAALREKQAVAEDRLLPVSRMMVWAADGLLEGAVRGPEIPVPEIRSALLSVWRGILATR